MADDPQTQPTLPPCGVYRTSGPLPGREDEVDVGVLIYFHNHSEQGPPLVLLPRKNHNNRWTFGERGWLAEDPDWVANLVPLKAQGFYVVGKEHLHLSREEIIPEGTLVQLGYNRKGDTILFPARFEGNSIHFPERGYRFESPDVQQHLRPAGFEPPTRRPDRVLH